MAARVDLLLDANGDLPIDAVGLMPVGNSDKQHLEDLLSSFKGEWKQFIFNGVGLAKYLKSTGTKLNALSNDAKQQMQRDGYSTGRFLLGYDATGKLHIYPNASI